MAFDLDAFLKSNSAQEFDPDAFLKANAPAASTPKQDESGESFLGNVGRSLESALSDITGIDIEKGNASKLAGRAHAAEESIGPTTGAYGVGAGAAEAVAPYARAAYMGAELIPGIPGMVARGAATAAPFVAGLATAIPTGAMLQKAQQTTLDEFPEVAKLLGLSKEERAKERAEDPYGEAVAGALPGFLTASPGALNKLSDLGQYGVNVGLQGALNLGSQLYENGGDWSKLDVGPSVVASLVGAAQMKPTRLGEMITPRITPTAPPPLRTEPYISETPPALPAPPTEQGRVPSETPAPAPTAPSRNMDAELADLLGIPKPEVPTNVPTSTGTDIGPTPTGAGLPVPPSEPGRPGVTGSEAGRLANVEPTSQPSSEGEEGEHPPLNFDERLLPPKNILETPSEEDLFQVGPASNWYYSPTQRAVENAKQDKAPANNWMSIIKGSPGVKKDELDALGLEDWLKLQQGQVSRDDVLNFVKNNGVQVKEASYGVPVNFSELGVSPEFQDYIKAKYPNIELNSGHKWEILSRSITERINTLYQDYIEALDSLPASNIITIDDMGDYIRDPNDTRIPIIENQIKELNSFKKEADSIATNIGFYNSPKYGSYRSIVPEKNNYRELVLTLPPKLPTTPAEDQDIFQHSHWPDLNNPLAHTRFSDFTDSQGNKVLGIHELQSDWGQRARDYGVKGAPLPELPEGTKIEEPNKYNSYWYVRIPEDYIEAAFEDDRYVSNNYMAKSREEAINKAREGLAKSSYYVVPKAPFIGDTQGWLNLILKRMMVYAAQNGYDKVAFPTGEQATKMFPGLENQFSKIEWTPDVEASGSNKGTLTAYGLDGDVVKTLDYISRKKLREYVGKELAEKLLAQPIEKIDSAEHDHISQEDYYKKLKELEDEEYNVLFKGGRYNPEDEAWEALQKNFKTQKNLLKTRYKATNKQVLTDLNVSVGGEGMRKFYDGIVPKTVQSLVKKFGGKYEPVELKGGKQPTAFTITPEMREKLGAPVPLFQLGKPEGLPVSARSPSQKAQARQIARRAIDGQINPTEAAFQIHNILAPSLKEKAPPVRDVIQFQRQMLEGVRTGRMSPEMYDFAKWVLDQNPNLIKGAALSISKRDAAGRPLLAGTQGIYSALKDIITLMPRANDNTTLVHEVMHRAERMMPPELQKGIRDLWGKLLLTAARSAHLGDNPALKTYYENLLEYHYGSGDARHLNAALDQIRTGAVPQEHYKLSNSSELWANHATDILSDRMGASKSLINRIKQWLKEFIEKVKDLFGFTSDAPIIRALNEVMNGRGEFVSNEQLTSRKPDLEQVRKKAPYERDPYENLTPEERKARIEEILRNRASREEQRQEATIPNTLKEASEKLGNWWERFKHNHQNILDRQQQIENGLDLRDKLVVAGPKANNTYMRMSSADSRFDALAKPIDARVHKIMAAGGDYAKAKGIDPKIAWSTVSSYIQALDAAGWRRQELFNRYRPLSESVIEGAEGSDTGLSPAEARRRLYDLANKISGDLSIPKDERLNKLRQIKRQITRIVNDDRNVDEKGHSYLPDRGEDAYGRPVRIPTNYANPIYHPAAGMDPYTVREILRMMDADLADPLVGPTLKKVLDQYKSLVKTKIRLEKIAGTWHEHLDDITYGLYGAENYAPMKTPRGDVDFTDLEGTRNLGDVAGINEGMVGGRHISENSISQMIYDTYRAAGKASKAGVALTVKNLIDSGDLAGLHIATIPAADRFLNPDFREQYPEASVGGTITYINKNGDTEIYKVADPLFLDGLRRPNMELNVALKAFRWTTSKIANQFTRLRLAFAPVNFWKHTMMNRSMLPATYNGLITSNQYLSQVASNLATGKGFVSYQVANLFNQGREAELRAWAAKDPWVRDTWEWIKGGGPAAYAQIMYPNEAPQRLKEITSGRPDKKVFHAIDLLLDNWNKSWDLSSRVTAYGMVKRIELANGRTPEEARQIAVNVAKDLANFNLRGKDPLMNSLYAFWSPATTTSQVVIDHVLLPAMMTDEAIERQIDSVLPEHERTDEESRDKVREKLQKTRNIAKGIVASLFGSGMLVYALNLLYCAATPWGKNSQGQNFLESDDKSRSIRTVRIPLPGGTIAQLHFGFGTGNIMSMGYQTAAVMMGHQTIKQYVDNIGRIASEFLPTQLSSMSPRNFFPFFIDTIAPTAIKPAVELAMNKDSLGHSIYNSYPGKVSDAYSGGSNVPELYKDMAEYAYKNLNLELSPNVLYYLSTNFFDGVADMAGMGNEIRLAAENKKPLNPKAFLGSFVGTKSDMDAQNYADISDKIVNMRQHLNDPDKAFVANWTAKNPIAPAAVQIYSSESGDIHKLQQDINTIRTNPYFTPQLRDELIDIKRNQLDVKKGIVVDKLKALGIEP